MAAGGYYGFAGGAVAAPQYSAQPAPAYAHPPVAATYAVQPTPGVDHAVAPVYPLALPSARPAAPVAYGAYQPPSGQDYSYGTRPPELGPPSAVAPNYQQEGYTYGRSPVASGYEAKPYYQAVATPAQHTATDSYYHSTSQSSYTQPVAAYNPSPPQHQVTPVKLVPAVNATASSYRTYSAATTSQASLPPPCVPSYAPTSSYASAAAVYNASAASYPGSSYSYDAAPYAASGASCYQPAQQQLVPPPSQPPAPPQQHAKPGQGGAGGPLSTPAPAATGPLVKKPPFPRKVEKAKGPPKQPQLHYCEICKVSCAGPQTYREHLEGQKHKKKEAALKAGSQVGGGGPRGLQAQLHCELCDISCTGVDAYVAHMRGAKHQKVLKLHTKLGKPIPSAETTLAGVCASSANGLASGKQALGATPASAATPAKPAVGGHGSATASSTPALARKPPAANLACAGAPTRPGSRAQAEQAKGTPSPTGPPVEEQTLHDGASLADLVGAQPVGHHYVEKVSSETGKVFRFHCKLCECSFNDPNAKDMHLKGRRHRLQYKKKVNPDLAVEIKPSSRGRKLQEEKLKSHQLRALVRQRQAEEQRWHREMRRYEQEMYWKWVKEEELYWAEQQRRHLAADRHPPPLMGRPGVPGPPLLPARRPSSSDDRHIMAKHASIYPTEEELQGIQKVVSHSERALRLISDWLAEQAAGKEGTSGARKGKTDHPPRLLKGVMRVGVLAKGLLLHGDRNVHLILLSAQKPTRGLLRRVAEQLPKELEKVTSDPYDITPDVEEAGLVVASGKDPKMQVTVSLTSLLMREEAPPLEAGAPSEDPQPDSAEVLDTVKCRESLAALRHTKWFQARANGLQSCVVLIRVLRDLCQRVPTWGALPAWALELLVERSLSSATGPLQPGEALRRVLECVASGILLTDGPGLQDPCEKKPVDALRGMSRQQREDVTASSQHALRMLAFRQIHRILGVEPLLPARSRLGAPAQKRRWGMDDEAEGQGDGKKGKPEEADHKAGV